MGFLLPSVLLQVAVLPHDPPFAVCYISLGHALSNKYLARYLQYSSFRNKLKFVICNLVLTTYYCLDAPVRPPLI